MHNKIARFTDEGLFTQEEIGTTCCFATQDKVWVTGPAGEKWEVYTVLADTDTFGTTPELFAADPTGGCACDSTTTAADAAELQNAGVAQARHALPNPMGPVLPRLHDARRHLPLPRPAFRLPPTPTHADRNGLILSRPGALVHRMFVCFLYRYRSISTRVETGIAVE